MNFPFFGPYEFTRSIVLVARWNSLRVKQVKYQKRGNFGGFDAKKGSQDGKKDTRTPESEDFKREEFSCVDVTHNHSDQYFLNKKYF